MAITFTKSPRIVTTPKANIWSSASTSVVTRVISLPTGVRSKYRAGSLSTWSNISVLRSKITNWPVMPVTTSS